MRLRLIVVVGLLLVAAPSAPQPPNLQGIDDAIRALNAAVDVLRVPATTVLSVPAVGNLQAALDAAAPGTTIELAQGATYTGNFILRNKAGAAPVTIRTAGLTDTVLPPTIRITMAETRLAKLTCQDCFYPILRAEPGTHDVNVIAVQFVGYVPAAGRQGPATPDRDLVQLGIALDGVAWYTTPAQFVSNVTFDRVQFTAGTAGGHRAALLDGRNLRVINSDCRGFWETGRDSQCFGATQGPGPYLIENNYLEAASENVIFGGNDPVIPNAIPRNIVIRGNHFSKPAAWRVPGRFQVKNLFELKNARDVLIEHNLFEHNWTDAQAGSAILFTVRNQDGGCSWCEVSDVVFRANVIRDVEGFAIAILGRDYTHPSATSQRITITQNLFLSVWHGIAVTGPLNGLTVTHNTIGSVRGRFLSLDGPATTGLVVRDNVVGSGEYGITGSNTAPGLAALTTFAPGFRMTHNVVEASSARTITYPAGNYLLPPGTLAGRLDATSGYIPATGQVSSDGLPLGVDVGALEERVAW